MKRANTINFGPAGAAEAASQAVSPPLARSPAALVVYAAHATHALFDTRSFAPHAVAAHAVSIPPDGSSPAARVVPAGHAVQLPDETCWFDAHAAPSHVVSDCVASSPAAFVADPVHATHAKDDTRSFVAHRVAVHVVSPPHTGSPAARVDPAGHATHAPLDTRWFVAHAAPSARVSVIVCLVTAPCPAAYPAEISTLNTLVRSAGAVHVNVFVPEAPEFAYCCAVPPHDFAVNPEMVVAVPALACANAADAKPVSVIVI